MISLATLNKAPLGILALVCLMLATRFHHFGSVISLPDASLAVFFLAGLWFGGLPLLAGLLLEAALIDFIAIDQFSVSDYCISPAYVFLIPTYATLYFAGHLAERFNTLQTRDMLLQAGLLAGATSVAFLISNGSFFVLSGRFSELSWAQYFGRVAQYYPLYLSSTLLYSSSIIIAVHLLKNLSFVGRHSNRTI